LIQTIRELAATYPHAEYQAYRARPDDPVTCRYDLGEVTNGPPGCTGCLIGQAAARLVPGLYADAPEWLLQPSYNMVLTICEQHTPVEMDWLQECQGAQDANHCWATAVEMADAKHGRPGETPPTLPFPATFLLTDLTGATVLGSTPVGYGNAYISVYPVLVAGKPPGQLAKGCRCKVRFGMHPNLPSEYWITRVE